MAAREPVPERTIVDLEEYFDRIPNRLLPEDLDDPDEVYVFYAPLDTKISRVAMRAYVSLDVNHQEFDGIGAPALISFRAADLSRLGSDATFPGRHHGGFFSADQTDPIIVKRGFVRVSTNTGLLVRGDETFENELADVRARIDLERKSELVGS